MHPFLSVIQQQYLVVIVLSNSSTQKKNDIKRGYTPNEILAMQFDMLGLSGKWKQLFGDVPHLFYFMIWGGAGSGKSTLAIEFAYYLAEKLNKKVCYVAEEQKISFSLYCTGRSGMSARLLMISARD